MTNFDPVARIYDATRGLPPDVAELVADTIVAATHATKETHFLEIGTGTGRIALPLVRRGYPFTGVDISEGMLDEFRAKAGDAPNLTLLEADIRALPLPDHSQDVALAIHVFHLVPEWRAALAEVRRVLRPNGTFIWGGNHTSSDDPLSTIRKEWNSLVTEMGGTLRQRYADWDDIGAEVEAQGGYTAVYQAAHWTVEFRPIDLITALHDRVFSASWPVEQDVLDAAHERLLAWGKEQFGDLEGPIEGHEEFLIYATQW